MRTQGQGEATQDEKIQSLARQGSSLFNLTLDEVQNQLGNLGKPLGSMNLDELLKIVVTVESDHIASGSFLNGQDINKKTVDEVWRYIQNQHNNKSPNQERKSQGPTQATLGEMTLEDFLVKAGVVTDSNISQHSHWVEYQLPSGYLQNNHSDVVIGSSIATGQGVQLQVQQSLLVAMDSATMGSPSSLMGALSDRNSPGRKRMASGAVVEKTVERRQKRMIKNRESAARSRARKQVRFFVLGMVLYFFDVLTCF